LDDDAVRDSGTEDHDSWTSGSYKKGGTICGVSKSFVLWKRNMSDENATDCHSIPLPEPKHDLEIIQLASTGPNHHLLFYFYLPEEGSGRVKLLSAFRTRQFNDKSCAGWTTAREIREKSEKKLELRKR